MELFGNEWFFFIVTMKGGMYMAQISVNNLTFGYEGSFDYVFENVSFSIDTNWRLGFIGRNGKGKTTFLNLLLGKYAFEGSISASTKFDYFPYEIAEYQMEMSVAEFMEDLKPGHLPMELILQARTLEWVAISFSIKIL